MGRRRFSLDARIVVLRPDVVVRARSLGTLLASSQNPVLRLTKSVGGFFALSFLGYLIGRSFYSKYVSTVFLTVKR